MRSLLPILSLLLANLSPLHGEETPVAPQAEDTERRWGFIGGDRNLRRTIAESDHILFICVYQTALEDVKPPFAAVVLSATVVEPFKGTHATGDKITIRFHTDSLPKDEVERKKFIAEAAENYLGSLKIAFLQGEKSADHSCDWTEVPTYSAEMAAFVKDNRDAKPETAPEKEAE